MSRTTAAMLACALALPAGAVLSAQAKVIPGEHHTASATVENVDLASRRVTLRDAKGELRTVTVPQEVTRLAEIKAGDTVKATYYENIVLRVKPHGEPDVDTHASADTPGVGARPAGTSASQQTITATITAIDLNEPSISLKGPRGWQYHSRVQDKQALKQVKVGDRVDITWTDATLVSVVSASK